MVELAVLFVLARSIRSEPMAAVLVKIPSSTVLVTMVAVAVAPLIIVPNAQVTVLPSAEKVRRMEIAESNEKAAGRASVKVTFAVDGPLLVTTMVKVTLLETKTLVGLAVCEIEMSALGKVLTMTFVEEELLAGSGSNSSPLMVAKLLATPAETAVVTMVTCPVPPGGRVGILHSTLFALVVKAPMVVLAESKVREAGRRSFRTTELAEKAPLLLTKFSVKVTLLLIQVGLGPAD